MVASLAMARASSVEMGRAVAFIAVPDKVIVGAAATRSIGLPVMAVSFLVRAGTLVIFLRLEA
jgi:hypothetical protein